MDDDDVDYFDHFDDLEQKMLEAIDLNISPNNDDSNYIEMATIGLFEEFSPKGKIMWIWHQSKICEYSQRTKKI
jgi:hypothetical protein